MIQWLLILLTVFSGSGGDILCARGMSQGGELSDFDPSGIARLVRYVITRRMVILGGVCYAISFFSLLGLLSVAQLSVAVPATALSFVIDTIGARVILHENVRWKRWAGVLCVTAGVILTVKSGPNLNTARTHSQPAHPTTTTLSEPAPIPAAQTSHAMEKHARARAGQDTATAVLP